MPVTRRNLLRQASALPLVAAPLLGGCADNAATCVDPDLLGAGERQMRETLESVDVTTIPAPTCANCQFFHGESGSSCGNCEILSGPVASAGYCTSWALKS